MVEGEGVLQKRGYALSNVLRECVAKESGGYEERLGKLLDMLTDPAEDLGKPKLMSIH